MGMSDGRQVLRTTGFSFAAWAIACAFLDYPGEMLLSGYVLTTMLRPPYIALLVRLWHAAPGLRPLLARSVRDPEERGYTTSGPEPGLGVTLFLMLMLLAPVLALGAWSLSRQPAATLAVWVALAAQGLIWRGVFVRFEESLPRNLSYNSLWMVSGFLFLFLATLGAMLAFFTSMFVPAARAPDWWIESPLLQYAAAILLLAGAHLRALMEGHSRANRTPAR